MPEIVLCKIEQRLSTGSSRTAATQLEIGAGCQKSLIIVKEPRQSRRCRPAPRSGVSHTVGTLLTQPGKSSKSNEKFKQHNAAL